MDSDNGTGTTLSDDEGIMMEVLMENPWSSDTPGTSSNTTPFTQQMIHIVDVDANLI